MPYLKVLSSKLGISPSLASSFNMQSLTGTQKLQLTAARIFGNSIAGNMRNGSRVLRKKFAEEGRVVEYDVPIWNPTLAFPYIENKTLDDIEFRRQMDKARKLRVVMRGIKIGKKKGGSSISIMSIYEKKKDAS